VGAVTSSQKLRKRCTRCSGALPAITAALIAPIEIPATQSGRYSDLGPNAQTYLIAGEVFPTAVRAKGAGFAASFAKAVMTVFLFPVLLADLGTATLLYLLVGASLLGALVTWLFRIETAGINLEEVGATAKGSTSANERAAAEALPGTA